MGGSNVGIFRVEKVYQKQSTRHLQCAVIVYIQVMFRLEIDTLRQNWRTATAVPRSKTATMNMQILNVSIYDMINDRTNRL